MDPDTSSTEAAGERCVIELASVRLPPLPAPYGSVRGLADKMEDALQEHLALDNEAARLAALVCIATWFPEAYEVAPCLRITAAAGADAVHALWVLSAFCRHAVVVTEVTLPLLQSLPLQQQLTLLIYESGSIPRKAASLLNASTFRGLLDGRTDTLAALFGPKLIAGESLSLENCIDVHVGPQLPSARRHRLDAVEQLAVEFQSRLFMYRLTMLATVVKSDFDAPPTFKSPIRDLGRSIGMCIADEGVCSEMLDLLRPMHEQVIVDSSTSDRALVLEGLLVASHDPRKQSVRVGELTNIVNAILQQRGETIELKARKVGAVLKPLGLLTERLTKAARGVRFRDAMRNRIHQLSAQYAVRSIEEGLQGCRYCERLARSGG